MPTITASHADLNRLIGRRRSLAQLELDLLWVKGELEDTDGDTLTLAIEDTNRPELWSAEGVAREIRTHLAVGGLPSYAVGRSGVTVEVDAALQSIRPQTVCAVVRGLRLTDEALRQLIQLQEKISETFGRRRREVALGLYDLHKITPPIRYFAADADTARFVPLGMTANLTLRDILRQHPKGQEYGHLLEGAPRFPLFQDAAGEVLSLPPIINSAHTGAVTLGTRDLFIECSGFSLRYLQPALLAMTSALAERGGRIESVDIRSGRTILATPTFTPKRLRVPLALITSIFGQRLAPAALLRLGKQAGMAAKISGRALDVSYPAYRQDVMHPVDIVEDLLIAAGYNALAPQPPAVASTGQPLPLTRLSEDLAELLVGLGAQEVMTYTLTNPDVLFAKLGAPPSPTIELDNPVSKTWSVFRPTLLPLLVEVLGRNTTTAYPQQIFEIGFAVRPNPRAQTRSDTVALLAWALAAERATFTEARATLDALCRALGLAPAFEASNAPGFVPGRTARMRLGDIDFGVIGEIHPQALANWKIEFPACAFELDLSALSARLR